MLALLTACKPSEQVAEYEGYEIDTLEAINVSAIPKRAVYNPSRTRHFDLLHTKLDVRFAWEKQHCIGRAELTLTPYFYAQDTLVLDAKGFDIHSIELLPADTAPPLAYTYDSVQLRIALPRTYTRNDTLLVGIYYTAKPNELEAGGSKAITSDIGLYFINADGSEADKPQQIWTQGETESSSCWFPTIDAPNERTTQELYITVQQRFTTLSNGLLQFSLDNGDGTRTDYWKQDQPHAPYLFMMAIGEYAVVQDTWRNIEVNYYVEPKYEPHARAIFGKTPAMLEFFSKLLGVEYPWDKYHQVVVRDYVSGAMENTSAVIFGEFVQQTPREMLDGDYEDVVAHELFHHWFGDLVTCESWANLPLNESFATYSEYLWREHDGGRDLADMHQRDELRAYLTEASYKREHLVRFNYDDKEAMFDSHSYAKGSLVLHMLRNHVGDEAFFASLRLFLQRHAYQPVEIHQLRLAFEEVTGEDLNWFFNQWFLDRSHPELKVQTQYNDSLQQVTVEVEQAQNFDLTPVYKLPVAIDVYHGSNVTRHHVVIDEVYETFSFAAAQQPDLVNFDAENVLLARIDYRKSPEEWAHQYHHAPLYYDRVAAVEACGEEAAISPTAATVVLEALSDPFWGVRLKAVEATNAAWASKAEALKAQLSDMAISDASAPVRAAAIKSLANHFESPALVPLYRTALKDSSYSVLSEALNALGQVNATEALAIAKALENEKSQKVLLAVVELYGTHGTDAQSAFFVQKRDEFSGFNQIRFIANYETYLLNGRDPKVLDEGIEQLGISSVESATYYGRIMALNALRNIREVVGVEKHLLEQQQAELDASNQSSSDAIIVQQNLAEVSRRLQRLDALIEQAGGK